MKGLLARIPWNHVAGIAIGDREIVLVRLALTLLGAEVIERHTEVIGDTPVDEALRRLLARFAGKPWLKGPVAVGIPTLCVLQVIRPTKGLPRDATPRVVFHESLRSAALNVDDLELAEERVTAGKSPLISVVGSRKKFLAPILAALIEVGIRPYTLEPEATALFRWSRGRAGAARPSKLAVEFFLGETQGLAMLTTQESVLLWRCFDLTSHPDGALLCTIYRSILRTIRELAIEGLPSSVIIQGRPDLDTLHEPAGWQGETIRVERREGPGYEPGTAATGLAMGCRPGTESFNLAPGYRQPPSIVRRIPWAQIAAQGSAVAASTALLLGQLAELERAHQVVLRENQAVGWMKPLAIAKIKEQKTDLGSRVEAIRGYLSGRVCWSTALAEIAEKLPPEMRIDTVTGKNEFVSGPTKPGTIPRSLTTTVEAPIPKGGAMPPEIHDLVGSLRADRHLATDWPTIEMTNLKWSSNTNNVDGPRATFTLLYQAKSTAATKPTTKK